MNAPASVRYLLRRVAQRALSRPRHGAAARTAFAARHRAIVNAFLRGYLASLDARDGAAGIAVLEQIELTLRGFAYEGAAMALACLDSILPARPSRLTRFVTTVAGHHDYLAHVGAGWAAARLWKSPDRARAGLDPLLGWLAVDGYGFHEGYFRTDRVIRQGARPRLARGYAARVFDQGVGRSLWFADEGDVNRIARSIERFRVDRRVDLWSGIGLAAAYAGGATSDQLRVLKAHAGEYVPQLAQGAAFAVEARARAGNPAEHTNAACEIFALRTAEDAARLVRELRDGLIERDDVPAYELWRQRVATALAYRDEPLTPPA
jgi:hypothetical protein